MPMKLLSYIVAHHMYDKNTIRVLFFSFVKFIV